MKVNEESPCWSGYKQVGMKQKNGKEVPNCVPESVQVNEENEPNDKELWSRAIAAAKAKYDVYPSAYANAFASNWYKEKGGTWKTKSESVDENFAVQMMVAKAIADQKVKNPETKKDVRVTTALKDKEHPAHGKAKSLVQRLKDKFSKKESVEESVNEGKHDDMLDKLADIVKASKSFMDIGKELKKNGIKYSFGTSPLPMYIIDKPVKIAILNNKYADGAERVVGTTAIGLMESVNESPSFKITNTISKKEWAKTHKDYKSVIDGVPYVMKLTDKGTALVPVKIVESVTEGKKVFKVNPQIGNAKYSISSHDGVKKHKDGSDFFDIETFKNKVDLEKAIKKYTASGFKMESVNEAASRTAMEIGGLTGMNKDAIQKFVDDNNLDIEKVYQFVKVGKLPERMALVSAIAGKPGNSVQVKLIKKFK